MPLNLIALCGPPGTATVRRVRTSATVQTELQTLFDVLEMQFREGVDQELAYDSRWNPGVDELATLQETSEARSILGEIRAGVLALQELDVVNFESQQIRALAVAQADSHGDRVLFQAFSAVQRLTRRFALLLNGNTFDRLEQPAFTLTNQIDVIAESGILKFKKFNVAKRIFDLSESYKEASDNEIRQFCATPGLEVDANVIIGIATAPIRKLISSVQNSGVLNNYTPSQIQSKSSGIIDMDISNGRIVLPTSKNDIKNVLTFLDHGIYRSPMDDSAYMANSRRPFVP